MYPHLAAVPVRDGVDQREPETGAAGAVRGRSAPEPVKDRRDRRPRSRGVLHDHAGERAPSPRRTESVITSSVRCAGPRSPAARHREPEPLGIERVTVAARAARAASAAARRAASGAAARSRTGRGRPAGAEEVRILRGGDQQQLLGAASRVSSPTTRWMSRLCWAPVRTWASSSACPRAIVIGVLEPMRRVLQEPALGREQPGVLLLADAGALGVRGLPTVRLPHQHPECQQGQGDPDVMERDGGPPGVDHYADEPEQPEQQPGEVEHIGPPPAGLAEAPENLAGGACQLPGGSVGTW